MMHGSNNVSHHMLTWSCAHVCESISVIEALLPYFLSLLLFIVLFLSISLSFFLFLSLSFPLFFFLFLSLINECMPEFLRWKWPNSYIILPSISRYLFSAFSLLLSLSLSFLFLRFSSVNKRKYFVRLTTVCKRDKKTVRCNFLSSHIAQRERERERERERYMASEERAWW